MPAPESPPLSRREMRARLFWLARWAFGGAEYHRGPIEVCIAKGKGRDKLTLVPEPGDELFDAEEGPTATDRLADLMPLLLATFVSADGLAVMKFVSSRGPAPAKAVVAGAGVERSRCYVMLQDLKDRGLIRDGGDGYELAAPEVWAELLRRG